MDDGSQGTAHATHGCDMAKGEDLVAHRAAYWSVKSALKVRVHMHAFFEGACTCARSSPAQP